MKQLAGQPSLSLLLPSSQVSPALSVPLPHSAGMMVLVVVDVVVGVEVLVVPTRLVEVELLEDVDVDVAVGDEVDVELVDEVDVELVKEVDVDVLLVVVVGRPAPHTWQPSSATPLRATNFRPVS